MNYTNVCKHCYKVFKAKIRTCTCKDCRTMDESYFDDIEQYLKLYPNSNALQISEELGIHVFTIVQYIDEGRLVMNNGTFSQLPEDEEPETDTTKKPTKKPIQIEAINPPNGNPRIRATSSNNIPNGTRTTASHIKNDMRKQMEKEMSKKFIKDYINNPTKGKL